MGRVVVELILVDGERECGELVEGWMEVVLEGESGDA